jgi:four helix bundle protein
MRVKRPKNPRKKIYDLEERTYYYAKKVNEYVKNLPYNTNNKENGSQLIRSAGSVAANYIEANESLSKKDLLMRIKISEKEAKESRLWLKLTYPKSDQEKTRELLIEEATELMNILGSIQRKLERK